MKERDAVQFSYTAPFKEYKGEEWEGRRETHLVQKGDNLYTILLNERRFRDF